MFPAFFAKLPALALPFPLDKQLHFFVGAFLAFLVALFTNPVAGLFAAVIAGMFKEAWDTVSGKGTLDVKDFLTTSAGGVFVTALYFAKPVLTPLLQAMHLV